MPTTKNECRAPDCRVTLRKRLRGKGATVDAIHTGDIDALVVTGPEGEQVFTLKGADQAYRVFVEAMNEGAVTVASDGTILYANTRFASLLKLPLEKVLGLPLTAFVNATEGRLLRDFLKTSAKRNITTETTLIAQDGAAIGVHLSGNPLPNVDLSGICVVVTDLTQRHGVEKAQRDLSRNILEVQEMERQRVARELHDGVNQLLSATKHRLHDIESHPSSPISVRRGLAQVRKLLDRTIGEMRSISRNLRPSELDDLGLMAAIRTLSHEFSKRNRVKVELKLSDLLYRLPGQSELNIYRIVQEALANVEKHARATHVRVELTTSASSLRLRIRDNGVGFAERRVNGSHWGLINMRERASHMRGAIEINTNHRGGTTVQLSIPL